MLLLKIYKAHEDAELCTLHLGEHIIGRGPMFQCFDKRVSRHHATITVGEDKVSLMSVHVNPCFLLPSNSKNVSLLAKSNSVELQNGDKFSLLPDQFWYKIKIENYDLKEENKNEGSSKADKNEVEVSRNCDPEKECQTKENSTKTDELDSSRQDRVTSDSTINTVDTTQGPCTSKRNFDKEPESGPTKRMRINLSSEAVNVESRMEHEENNEDELILKISNFIDGDSQENSLVVNPFSAGTSEAGDKNENNAKNNVPEEEDKDRNNEKEKNDAEGETTDSVKDSVDDVEVKTEDRNDAGIGESQAQSSSKDTSDSKQQNGGSSKGQDVNDSASKAGDANGASTSHGAQSRLRRDRCWYRNNCYRKSQHHHNEFSHPGDDDYDSDPDDKRPTCSFGAACYRRNMLHRQQYKHPGPPAPPPTGVQLKPKRQRKAAAKKTKAQGSGSETSEDDYDYDDPFIDDGSSDEYVAESDDSDTDDTEYTPSQESSEDMRTLVKEAKKFTKK